VFSCIYYVGYTFVLTDGVCKQNFFFIKTDSSSYQQWHFQSLRGTSFKILTTYDSKHCCHKLVPMVSKNLVSEPWIYFLIPTDEVDVLADNVITMIFLDSTALRWNLRSHCCENLRSHNLVSSCLKVVQSCCRTDYCGFLNFVHGTGRDTLDGVTGHCCTLVI
jgi:hypothetical protein